MAARYEGDDGAGGDGKDVGSKEGFSSGTGKGGGFDVTGGNGRTFLSCVAMLLAWAGAGGMGHAARVLWQ